MSRISSCQFDSDRRHHPSPSAGEFGLARDRYFMDDFHNLSFQLEKFRALLADFSEMDKKVILEVLDLSLKKHAHQKRKSGADYIIHPVRVANILMGELKTNQPDLVCAALLHDTIEDTDLTAEEITRKFGEGIARLVVSLSKKSGELNGDYLQRALGVGGDVTRVKLCDRLDNCRDLTSIASYQPDFVRRQISEVEDFYLPYTQQFEPYFDRELRYNIELAKNLLK